MSLTSAQQHAVNARGNVLVVAGAGTGKTRALVERCLSCLLDEKPPLSLDELLIVTFTEAAATEIRQRIRLRLEQELSLHPGNFRWHEQLALFDTAYIGTLHSFCLQIIRPHFYELAIDPQFAVVAEDEARLLADETLSRVLESHYDGRSADAKSVQQLIQSHGAGSDHTIRALVLRLHHYAQTLPDPAGWFQKQLELFSTVNPIHWGDWLLAAFIDWRRDVLPLLDSDSTSQAAQKCAAILRAAPVNPSREKMADVLENISRICEAVPRKKKPAWLKTFAPESQFLNSLAESGEKIDPLIQDWEWVRHPMITLLKLTREFGDAYLESKRQLGVLDFHDLEQYALRLLWNRSTNQPTKLAAQWQRKLRFIFVDEYQDINAAQNKLIEVISRDASGGNRFLVGDVKQSIYRFRQADPHIFQGYAATWKDGAGETVIMGENFRSRKGILDFINTLFGSIMQPEIGGVSYDEQAKLILASSEEISRHQVANKHPDVELLLRVKAPNGDAEADLSPDDTWDELIDLEEAAKEARLVALRLRELKAQQYPVWDEETKSFRSVSWGDIAVLLRAPAGKSECYAKEFRRLNIPLLVQRSGFYDSIEVSDLVNLLQTLDNPLQDVPVLAVLHSPLAGLTINELAEIRLAAKGPFWTALVFWNDSQIAAAKRQGAESKKGATSNSQGGEVTFRKVSSFLERHSRWRRLARQSSLSRCLETALSETQYDTFLLTQPRGEERHANVQRLLRLAQQFDSFQRQGLFRFLRFIDAQKRADTEPEVKPSASEDSVRLMSIHQSKGLEFPVVVVADLNKPFNLVDLRGAIILDEHYGLCPQIKPPHTGKRYPSLPYWLATRRQRRELLGEELRLLYVALTRARDTLILSASLSQKRLTAIGSGNFKLLSLKDARGVFDWIGHWFSSHQAEAAPAFGLNAPGLSGMGELPIPSASIPSSGQTSLLSWTVHTEDKLLEAGAEIPEEPAATPPETSADVWARLRERLSFSYSFPASISTPSKASVTGLRRRASAQLDEEVFGSEIPDWKPKELRDSFQNNVSLSRVRAQESAAQIGNAHHRFLQLVSLERTGSSAELDKEARRLAGQNILTDTEYQLLNFDALAAFWNSELGVRIRANKSQLRRELQFTTRFSVQSLAELLGGPLPASAEDEFVVVQGVADLVMLLPTEIWLVDFKTDTIKPDALDIRTKLYEPQMKMYARALGQIYRRPVTGCWIYFLNCRTAVEIISH